MSILNGVPSTITIYIPMGVLKKYEIDNPSYCLRIEGPLKMLTPSNIERLLRIIASVDCKIPKNIENDPRKYLELLDADRPRSTKMWQAYENFLEILGARAEFR